MLEDIIVKAPTLSAGFLMGSAGRWRRRLHSIWRSHPHTGQSSPVVPSSKLAAHGPQGTGFFFCAECLTYVLMLLGCLKNGVGVVLPCRPIVVACFFFPTPSGDTTALARLSGRLPCLPEQFSMVLLPDTTVVSTVPKASCLVLVACPSRSVVGSTETTKHEPHPSMQ